MFFKTCLSPSSADLYNITSKVDANLLALGDGTLGLNVKLNTEMLETLELIINAEISKVGFEFLVVADSSLTSSLFLAPLLSLCQTAEFVADAAARMVVEFREAIEVRSKDE